MEKRKKMELSRFLSLSLFQVSFVDPFSVWKMNVSLKQQLQCSLINMRSKEEKEKIRIKSVAHCRQPHAVIFVDIIVFFFYSFLFMQHKLSQKCDFKVFFNFFYSMSLFFVHFLCSSGAKGTEIEVKYMNGKSYKNWRVIKFSLFYFEDFYKIFVHFPRVGK